MINKVILIGNCCKDPDCRATADGKDIVNLTVATSERWKDKMTGERKEKSEFHRVVVFGNKLATFAEKGSKVYIEGALQTRKWTALSGVEKFTTEVIVQGFGSKFMLLDKKEDATSGFAAHAKSLEADDLDDSIPFVWIVPFTLFLSTLTF